MITFKDGMTIGGNSPIRNSLSELQDTRTYEEYRSLPPNLDHRLTYPSGC